MEIMPAQTHIHWESSVKVGVLLIRILGEPGIQGAGIFGMQGIGVSVPAAAAVAAATVGFAGEEQTPNGGILAMGA